MLDQIQHKESVPHFLPTWASASDIEDSDEEAYKPILALNYANEHYIEKSYKGKLCASSQQSMNVDADWIEVSWW